MPNNPRRIALLGGSFNPLHYGHLRLAVEVREAISPDSVVFIPCANPPHKDESGLLPFELRAAILEEAVKNRPGFQVSRMEAERSGPSYTVDTLFNYRVLHPDAEIFFIMGAEDFKGIRAWKDWRALPALAQLLVVARQGVEADEFAGWVAAYWPESLSCPASGLCPESFHALRLSFSLPGLPLPEEYSFQGKSSANGLVHYLDLPRLDISASLIRERWLHSRSIDYWVPEAVTALLESDRKAAEAHWTTKTEQRHA